MAWIWYAASASVTLEYIIVIDVGGHHEIPNKNIKESCM